MRISELPIGADIQLMVTVNGKPLKLDTVVEEVNPKKNYIIAGGIIKDDKPVSFRGSNVNVNILYTVSDAKPLLFKSVASKLLQKTSGEYCYLFTVAEDAVEYNRRENFRCYIDVLSSAQFGFNSAAKNVIIRDVSVTGFAVICDNNVDVGIGSFVHTVLNDQPQPNGTIYSFHLFGLVARRQELDNNKVLYGCQLNHPVAGLNGYIMEKERIKLKRNS